MIIHTYLVFTIVPPNISNFTMLLKSQSMESAYSIFETIFLVHIASMLETSDNGYFYIQAHNNNQIQAYYAVSNHILQQHRHYLLTC